jgi:hypothetical protein
MKRKSIILLVGAVLIAAGLLGQTPAQAYEKWVEFTIVRITEPATGSTVPQGKTISLKCVAAIDIDVVACVASPTQVNDPLTFTWTATAGTFSDSSGPEATWTAPAANGNVTFTVTASDETTTPTYADDANRSHSITVTVVNPGIRYVKANATGSNDGTSWANAYTDLNNAITQASAGSEFWVAAGTYKPDGTYRSNSITINKDLKIYGGFAATETALYQRDWVANETILSGDIGTVGSDADNSYWVSRISNSSAVLDGFTVTKGRGANTDGAGTYISGYSPTIRNCTYKDNITDGGDADGGGIHCWNASPTVIGCLFIDNEAGDDGGAVCNKSGSSGKYINCAFYSNAAQGDNAGRSDGGAIFNTASETYPVASNPTFVNCAIAGNSTARDGGGAATEESSSPACSVTYVNCTFYGNTAGDDGGALACKDGCSNTVKNCILWANDATSNGDQIWNSSSTVTVSYSDVQGSYTGTGNINSDPSFAKTADLDGADNRWLTFDDGLRIRFDSPCVDAADGDAKDSYTDADANVRDALGLKHIDIRTVTNTGTGTPAYYDMGAYEAAVEHVIFISVDGLAGLHLDDDTLMGSASSSVMPNMKRFRDEGMWTYNARTDYAYTETTPNHVTMLTGRPVTQPAGWANTTYHGWYYNGSFTDQSYTLHAYYEAGKGNPNVSYEASVYDVVHDRGGTTAEYAGKDKFIIHEWSYDLDSGRLDQVTPPDDTRDKIGTFEWTTDAGDSTAADWNSSVLLGKFIDGSNKPEYDFNFVFLHLKGPDKVGHQAASPWNSATWDNAVKDVDSRLGTVLSMVESSGNKAWYDNTVIVITADHGGTGTGHGDATNQYNFTIPFGVWGHLIPHGDAYTYSDGTRVSPTAGTRPDYNAANKPIRHADGVDLALNLMGMPSIDGASITGMGIGQ